MEYPGYRLPVIILSCVFMSLSVTNPSTNDSVLVAYKLSTAQELEISALGASSTIWDIWSRINTHDSLKLDYVSLTPDSNAWCSGPFNGPTDASMIWMAAYGANGIYLAFDITDNVWQPPLPTPGHYDRIEISFDTLDASSINNCDSCRPLPPYFGTKATDNVLFPVMTDYPNAHVTFDYFDVASNATIYWGYPFDSIPVKFSGMRIEGRLLNDHLRRIELFVPWQWIGHGKTGTMPLQDRRFACAGGYDDADSSNDPAVGNQRMLRWEKLPPQPIEYCYLSSPPENCHWRDLEIGPDLSDIVSVLPRIQRGLAFVSEKTYNAKNQYYNLNGRLIAPRRIKNLNGVMVECRNGISTTSQMISR